MKMKTTKILKISSDADYAVVVFISNNKRKLIDIWNEAMENEDHTTAMTFDDEDEILIEALEFGEVDPKFLEFISDEADYDDTKHNYWIVVDDEESEDSED
jgi:hypothetical protein